MVTHKNVLARGQTLFTMGKRASVTTTIDVSGHFSSLNTVILGRFYRYAKREKKNPSLGNLEVDSSLNLCVTLVMQLI